MRDSIYRSKILRYKKVVVADVLNGVEWGKFGRGVCKCVGRKGIVATEETRRSGTRVKSRPVRWQRRASGFWGGRRPQDCTGGEGWITRRDVCSYTEPKWLQNDSNRRKASRTTGIYRSGGSVETSFRNQEGSWQ